MKKQLLCGALAFAVAAALWGHEFFVMPDEANAYKAGDTVQINVLSTHYFTVGEETESAEVNDIYIVKNGRREGGSSSHETAAAAGTRPATALPTTAPSSSSESGRAAFCASFPTEATPTAPRWKLPQHTRTKPSPSRSISPSTQSST
jgi:hypothetical protein